MTLCPIASVAGCKKCPAFNMCPLKSTLGDYKPEEPAAGKRGDGSSKPSAKSGK
jgi:hypothetical protein